MEFAKNYLSHLTAGLSRIPLEQFEKIAGILLDAYDKDKQVFIFGNGGSASIASHMACDLGKGTLSNVYDHKEKRFRVIALTDNMSLFSALANDLGYEHVFSQQLRNLVQTGDVVIGISGSGNSPNVINGLILAKHMGATTIGFVGFDGGKMKKFCDHSLHFEEHSWQLCEDAHSIFQHIITSYVAKKKGERDLNQKNVSKTRYGQRSKNSSSNQARKALVRLPSRSLSKRANRRVESRRKSRKQGR